MTISNTFCSRQRLLFDLFFVRFSTDTCLCSKFRIRWDYDGHRIRRHYTRPNGPPNLRVSLSEKIFIIIVAHSFYRRSWILWKAPNMRRRKLYDLVVQVPVGNGQMPKVLCRVVKWNRQKVAGRKIVRIKSNFPSRPQTGRRFHFVYANNECVRQHGGLVILLRASWRALHSSNNKKGVAQV